MRELNGYIDHLLSGYDRNTLTLVTMLIAIALGVALRFLIYFGLRIYRWRTQNMFASLLLKHLRGILLIVLPVFFLLWFLPLMDLAHNARVFFQRSLQIVFILSFAWLLIRLMFVLQDYVLYKYDIQKPDNVRERKIWTQMIFIRKMAVIVIVILAIALVFTRFEGMRRLGTGILTSAGILGIIMGFAAQRSIANLLAGLQIAFTQPIRIDDVVIVEGEWGRIEEITLTYVVVRIWDLRRMVLPITYFIEKPFQNWTRNTADLMGTVFIHTDYSIPVDEVRKEMERVVHESPLWDKMICLLQVTDTSDKSMELRCLVSAKSSSDLFDLRCALREALIAFIQQNYPQSLPKFRVVSEKSF